MNETSPLPDDSDRLRVIATYLQLELARVQRRLATAEQREREQQLAHQAAARSAKPAWTVQVTLGAEPRPIVIHHGECTVGRPRVRPITRRDAIEALTAGVEACGLCRPDRELRVD
ncbi:DUF6233 domain-containing protein [Streptomyces decoyicus]|uniref:DUF6233 domain-containing protein n=1 Tax=Streptomyces decoyicus TaxID=249567 RepID=UPI0038704EBE